ncbi:MAG: TrkA family potassium uptake protein, partial [candidate division Zixibacteria bacterium]|nr:TrkA family potassium uptake protein [candidate division Zixibacteria bacterium]
GLTRLKCKVTAIDTDKTRVQSLQDYSQIVAILADATDRKFLENLNPGQFDCVIISTGEDTNAAILITLYANELGARRIIVKAKSDDHARILSRVGATETVIPEEQMATKLSRSLAQPNLIDFLPLANQYVVAEIEPPAHFIGKTLQELRLRSEYHVQVIAVRKRPTEEFIFVLSGEYTIEDVDVLVLVGKEEHVRALRA